MDKRTVGLIIFMKQYDYDKYVRDESITLKDIAIEYMMGYSGCGKEVYTKNKIESIIFESFCDFIDAVDRPSYYIKELKEIMILKNIQMAREIYMSLCSQSWNWYRFMTGINISMASRRKILTIKHLKQICL